jgi:hypothetical protein
MVMNDIISDFEKKIFVRAERGVLHKVGQVIEYEACSDEILESYIDSNGDLIEVREEKGFGEASYEAIVYRKNGVKHRLDGPAEVINEHCCYGNGSFWYKEGKQHRLDGPAKEYSDGWKKWYYEDRFIGCSSQEDFERLIRPHLSGSLLM